LEKLVSRALLAVILTIALYAVFVIFSDISLLIEKFQNFNFLVLIPAFSLVLTSYFIRGFEPRLSRFAACYGAGTKDNL